jgi:hypothetical protein
VKWVFLLVFGAIGAPIFIAGLVWGAKRYALMKSGFRADGTVVENVESTSSRGGRDYYPKVEFKAFDGKTYRFQGSTGTGGAPEYEINAKVQVIYQQDNPSAAQLADFDQFWLGPLIVAMLGFVMVVLGIGTYIAVGDDDKTFGPEFQQQVASVELITGKKGIPLPAVVREIKTKPGKGGQTRYVVLCRGGAPGGAEREFESAPLSFDPGAPIIGKKVTVYADPADPDRYAVDLEALFRKDSY